MERRLFGSTSIYESDAAYEPRIRGQLAKLVAEPNQVFPVSQVYPHELRPFLEAVYPDPLHIGYFDNPGVAEMLVQKGIRSSVGQLHVPMAIVREDGGTALAVEQPITTEEFLKKCSLELTMTSMRDVHKLMKRLKRTFAPHRWFGHGTILDTQCDIDRVLLDRVYRLRRNSLTRKTYLEMVSLERTITVRHASGGELNDGLRPDGALARTTTVPRKRPSLRVVLGNRKPAPIR